MRQKLEDSLDNLSCNENCLTHNVFVMKYKELVECTKCFTLADMIEKVNCFI